MGLGLTIISGLVSPFAILGETCSLDDLFLFYLTGLLHVLVLIFFTGWRGVCHAVSGVTMLVLHSWKQGLTIHWERSPQGLQSWGFESQLEEEYQLLCGMNDFAFCLY